MAVTREIAQRQMMIGKRCQLSEVGKEMFQQRLYNRTGTITGESHDQSAWIVKWDNRKTAAAFHKSFIQPL